MYSNEVEIKEKVQLPEIKIDYNIYLPRRDIYFYIYIKVILLLSYLSFYYFLIKALNKLIFL